MKNFKFPFIIAVLSIVVATSCSDDNVENSTPSAVDTKTWALDANIDSSVKPGDNFFMYCNGTWWNNTEIPAGMSSYGISTDMENQIAQIQQTMSDPRMKKLNEDILDAEKDTANALDAIREKYLEVCNISSKQEAWEAYAKLMGEGYILDGYRLQIKPDNGIMVVAMKDTKLKSTTEEWKQYALKRLGVAQTETGDITDSAQGYDALGAFLKIIGVSADNFYNGDASLVTNIYESNSAENLKDMVETTILDDVANVSYNDLVAYYSYEQNTNKPDNFGVYKNYINSYAFVNACLTEDLKNEYRAICEQMRTSFRKRIESLDWMSSTTKQNAIEKLNAMKFNIGGPEKWREEALPSLDDCQSYVEDIIRLRQSFADLYRALAGTDAQDACLEWALTVEYPNYGLDVVNASYEELFNVMNIYPIWLLSPQYDNTMSDACNYATFSVIGHEMTHGFDKEGSQYDGKGKSKNWWAVADKMEFEERQQLLIDCYNNLELMPDELPNVFANGEATITENVADLGGVLIAHDAYMEKLAADGFTGDELAKQEKRFFQAYADLWRNKYTAEYAQYCKKEHDNGEDNHSTDKERINGVVMNIDRWYELYDVQWGDLLYLKPEKRAKIW